VAGDRAGQSGEQPTVGERVIGRNAEQAIGFRGGEALFHQLVIEDLEAGGDRTQRGEPGAVGHHLTNGDATLAIGAEFGPVLRHRSGVVEQPAVGQPVDDRGGDALGRGEDDGSGLLGPWGVPRAPGPDLDEWLTVQMHRQPRAHATTASECLRETAHQRSEFSGGAPAHPDGEFAG
jgi:hypothetical protein